MKNVYNDAAYALVRKTLHEQLDNLRIKYGDSDSLQKKFLPKPAL
jgi:hypothetical protein